MEMTQEATLSGQVALVTGGGRGIGRAIARRLAAGGVAVAVTARSADQLDETVALIEEDGGKAVAYVADVTDQVSVEQMVANVERELGPLSLLVNNAGSPGMSGPIWVVDPDEWWRCLDVNLRGPFLCARSVMPGMIERRSGRVVTISSGASRNPWPNVSAYAISKAAVNRFSENLALEAAPYDVFAFAVSPGFVLTELVEVATSPEWRKWDDGIANLRDSGADRPPEDVAELIAALATGKYDALSGCHIDVSQDLDALLAHADEIEQGALYRLREQSLSE
jgi:NAD(P)-dependent dehydrogenase (short-subunit alcohol dehydrogenase family)